MPICQFLAENVVRNGGAPFSCKNANLPNRNLFHAPTGEGRGSQKGGFPEGGSLEHLIGEYILLGMCLFQGSLDGRN